MALMNVFKSVFSDI